MKKFIGILVVLLVLMGIVYFFTLAMVLSEKAESEPVSSIEKITTKVGTNSKEEKINSELVEEVLVEDLAVAEQEIDVDKCRDFRDKHPKEETAFNEIMADIFMSDDDARGDSAFVNMDWVSLNALANGGDKDALFFLGDGISIKAIFGKDFYGQKEERNSPSEEEINKHKVQMDELKKGFDLLFKAGVRGKLGAFLSLQMNSDLATRHLIRTEPNQESQIKHLMADLIAYNRLLSFIHTKDEPFRLMFARDAKNYYKESIEKHYKNWKPNLPAEQKAKELRELHQLADNKYQSFEQRWIQQREFYGFEVHPKLLERELEAYLMQVSELCWR